MMRLVLIIIFCFGNKLLPAQTTTYAKLDLVYPAQLTYDTLLVVTYPKGEVLSEISNFNKDGKKIRTYRLNVDSTIKSYFSIYFGGSLSAVNDSLHFKSVGKKLVIELKDSFSLRDNIHFELRNVYNFEDLYERYNQFYSSEIQKYDSLIKNDPSYPLSRAQHSVEAGFDFVKSNIDNPYSKELFSVFVINNPIYPVEYGQANEFYKQNLKNKITTSSGKKFVEDRMERLKNSLKEGTKAPFFSARSIQGASINANYLSGKNVLLIFWATWCGPCMEELPYLKQINEEYKGENLQIVSVSLDRDSLKMIKVINENKLNWTHIFNSRATTEAFRINPIPAMFLIDEKGLIIYNKFNRENETETLEILNSVLKLKFKH